MDQYISGGLLDAWKNNPKSFDLKAIEKYKKQIASGKYEPIAVSPQRYSNTDVLDGSHRIIAAYELGLPEIDAAIDTWKPKSPRSKPTQ